MAHSYLVAALYAKGDYVKAWDEVHTMHNLKSEPNPQFTAEFRVKMLEPRN